MMWLLAVVIPGVLAGVAGYRVARWCVARRWPKAETLMAAGIVGLVLGWASFHLLLLIGTP